MNTHIGSVKMVEGGEVMREKVVEGIAQIKRSKEV